eukprot:c22601_g2_i2 orf=158-499(+)
MRTKNINHKRIELIGQDAMLLITIHRWISTQSYASIICIHALLLYMKRAPTKTDSLAEQIHPTAKIRCKILIFCLQEIPTDGYQLREAKEYHQNFMQMNHQSHSFAPLPLFLM